VGRGRTRLESSAQIKERSKESRLTGDLTSQSRRGGTTGFGRGGISAAYIGRASVGKDKDQEVGQREEVLPSQSRTTRWGPSYNSPSVWESDAPEVESRGVEWGEVRNALEEAHLHHASRRHASQKRTVRRKKAPMWRCGKDNDKLRRFNRWVGRSHAKKGELSRERGT